jgi:hypothetical protein
MQIAASPDLTEPDRFDMIASYEAEAERWKNRRDGGVNLRAAGERDIATSLLDIANGRLRNDAPLAATLLKNASDAIRKSRDKQSIPAEAALEPESLAARAALIRDELDRANYDVATTARAAKEFAAAIARRA